jgi:hypothetical protein
VEIRLLGPVEIVVGGDVWAAGAARPAFDAALDIYDDLDPRAAARTRAALEGK